MNRYEELMNQFLDEPGNKDFKELFPRFHITLVCDKIGLTGIHKTAFDGLKRSGQVEQITWKTFLLRTKKMHEAFLREAERQRRDAAKS